MQKGSMAEKKKVYFDREEIRGLVSVSEIVLEKGMIEVPEFHRIRQLQNGVTKVPAIDLVYRIDRNSPTYKFWKDFYFNDEDHDGVISRTDAHGVEFGQTLLPGCECVKYTEPPYEAANPTFAQISVRIIPWDIIPLD